jgi:hypothetical protein
MGRTRQIGNLERFDEVLCLVVPDVDVAIVERGQDPGLARMEVNRLDSVRTRRELTLLNWNSIPAQSHDEDRSWAREGGGEGAPECPCEAAKIA